MDTIKKRKTLSPYLLVILSFFVIIMLGGFLLCCPFSNTDGKWSSFIDSVFTATSSTCVTGLSVFVNGVSAELTFFGQVVMAVMIQLGGLGFVTILAFIITLFKRRLQIKDRFFFAQAVSAESIGEMTKFVRKIILISFCCELIGFLLYLPVFLQLFPNSVGKALWNSLFTSISAFNNAGFDLLGNTSFVQGLGNPLMDNLPIWALYYLKSVTMLLIIFGGLSFLVIMEVFSFKKKPSQYRTFTKIVLSTTIFLILGGMVALLLTDGLKSYQRISPFDALFQSVTCRTAGFAGYNQANLSVAGRTVSCILMYVGGSPLSTAGGIKTTTAFMIVLAMYKYLRGKKVAAFKRSYSSKMVLKATSLLIISLSAILISYLIIVGLETNNSYIGDRGEIVYDIFSAFGTVGLSTGITPYFSWGSKIVLCFLMFIGRLGPMTLFQVFQKNMDKDELLHYAYVEEDFLIG